MIATGDSMFRHFNPVELYFGSGTLEKAGGLAARYGSRALVVTGRSSMKKIGALDRLLEVLEEAGVAAEVFGQVEPNPSFATVDRGAQRARDGACDLVIGLGGGSPMDAAKAIAMCAATGRPVADFFAGGEPEDALPVLEIASTSGTGSEADRYLVLTNQETREKQGWGHRLTYPRASMVDVELMRAMPPRLTAATGLDAFFHGLEAYVSTAATPLTELYAVEAMRLVVENLEAAYEDGGNVEARTGMAWASTLAGMAIDGGRTTLLHGLEHPVSGHLDVPHGEGLAALSLAYLEFILPACPEKCARIASLLGVGPAAENSIEGLRRLLQSVDMDGGLAELGVTEEMVDRLARDAGEARRLLETNPRPASPEDIRRLYRQSLEGG